MRSAIAEIVPESDVRQIGTEDTLRNLGANSIDRVEIISLFLREEGARVAMQGFARAKKLGDILDIARQDRQGI